MISRHDCHDSLTTAIHSRPSVKNAQSTRVYMDMEIGEGQKQRPSTCSKCRAKHIFWRKINGVSRHISSIIEEMNCTKQNKTKQKLPNINYWKKTCTSLCPVGRDPAWAHGKEDAIMLCAALLMISEMFRFAISCDHHRFQHLIFILINYCGYVYYVGWRLTDTMNLTYAAFCRYYLNSH